MHTQTLTEHALLRMAQRGISDWDLELIQTIGVEVEGGLLVTRKASQETQRTLKRLQDRLRRIEGTRVVVAEGRIVTTYHTNPSKSRRLLRE